MTNVVPDTLTTGPDPSAADAPATPGIPAIDDGMRWMVEFAEAERIGMGLRVPIPDGVSEVSHCSCSVSRHRSPARTRWRGSRDC